VCSISSCPLCLSDGRASAEKLIVSLKLDRNVVCSLLHEELLQLTKQGLMPCLFHDAEA